MSSYSVTEPSARSKSVAAVLVVLYAAITEDVAPPVGGVPEPATWAILIAGFGFVGTAMRRRRIAIASA